MSVHGHDGRLSSPHLLLLRMILTVHEMSDDELPDKHRWLEFCRTPFLWLPLFENQAPEDSNAAHEYVAVISSHLHTIMTILVRHGAMRLTSRVGEDFAQLHFNRHDDNTDFVLTIEASSAARPQPATTKFLFREADASHYSSYENLETGLDWALNALGQFEIDLIGRSFERHRGDGLLHVLWPTILYPLAVFEGDPFFPSLFVNPF